MNTLNSLLATLCFCTAPAAMAQSTNIVLNGTFENGVEGWTFGSGTSLVADPTVVHEGMIAVQGRCLPTMVNCFTGNNWSHVRQVLGTDPGQSYTLTFWARSQKNMLAEIVVEWNGVNLAPRALTTLSDYQQYTYTGLLAENGATSLKIYLGNHSSINVTTIDDISVYGTVPPGVPEPGPAAMLLAGLGVVGLAGRRRRAQQRGQDAVRRPPCVPQGHCQRG